MPEETLRERRQPYNEEAERSVIGSMMSMDKEAIMAAAEILSGEDFYFRRYQVIFDAVLEINAAGLDADPITVQNKLREKDISPEVADFDYLRSLVEAIPTSANVRSYAQIVWEKAVLRRLIKVSENIAAEAYTGKEPLDDILDRTERAVFDLARSGRTETYTPISKIAMDVFHRIEEASRSKSMITGLATGYSDLDYKLSGLQKSDLILVAARPSMGKTALVLNIAQNIAVKSGKRRNVAIFSLEMSKEQLTNRLFAMQSGINSQNLRNGQLTPAQWGELSETVNEIGRSGLIIDDTPGISVSEMRSRCRKYDLDCGGLDLIVVDYLQLMSSGRKNGDSRQQEISDISRGLKSLAREMKVPVIALSQLSRAVEGRQDKRPMLSDLRESGAIEQDADVVMFLFRDDYYTKEQSQHPGETELIIAKQRNGPTGTVYLGWLAETTRFVSLQREPRGGA
ncbi:MAG: replicative DNA helicase [Lachnospiraceae bacterium]|nr:replicative DNA helicase [Lachnospiraceae bacterium]